MQEAISKPTELINDNKIALDSKCLERAVACLVKIIHLIHHGDIRNQHQVWKLLSDIHPSSLFPRTIIYW